MNYAPMYYRDYYAKDLDTNSNSSTESDDSPNKNKTIRKPPDFFHKDDNYCGMEPRKKPRTKSKSRNSRFDQDKEKN